MSNRTPSRDHDKKAKTLVFATIPTVREWYATTGWPSKEQDLCLARDMNDEAMAQVGGWTMAAMGTELLAALEARHPDGSALIRCTACLMALSLIEGTKS